jgi:hypothetical protein
VRRASESAPRVGLGGSESPLCRPESAISETAERASRRNKVPTRPRTAPTGPRARADSPTFPGHSPTFLAHSARFEGRLGRGRGRVGPAMWRVAMLTRPLWAAAVGPTTREIHSRQKTGVLWLVEYAAHRHSCLILYSIAMYNLGCNLEI